MSERERFDDFLAARSLHVAPPHIERILRSEDLRRARRTALLLIGVTLLAFAAALWLVFHVGN